MIKSYDNCANQVISWNEFEVIARNCPHAGPFANRRLADKNWDFDVQVRQNANLSFLDMEQVLDYTYMEEDMEHMNEFRVKRNNERFEFSVENPSDKAFQQHAAH